MRQLRPSPMMATLQAVPVFCARRAFLNRRRWTKLNPRNALARLQTQTNEYEASLVDAQNVVQAAVLSVIAPQVRSALENVRRLDREMLPLMAILKFAQETGTEHGPTSPARQRDELNMRAVLMSL